MRMRQEAWEYELRFGLPHRIEQLARSDLGAPARRTGRHRTLKPALKESPPMSDRPSDDAEGP